MLWLMVMILNSLFILCGINSLFIVLFVWMYVGVVLGSLVSWLRML